VATSTTPGYYESRTLATLHRRLGVTFQVHQPGTLFQESQLPFQIADLPEHFTPFRQAVDGLEIPSPLPAPSRLPPPPAAPFEPVLASAESPHTALPIRGGTVSGQRRLRQFIFEQQAIVDYKQTRNCLNGLEGSSTLSPWLANGSLSPREVAESVRRFEAEHVKNESTYWLLFELLWREFFHWRALQDSASLFRLRPAGGRKRLHKCTFEPRSFARWSSGCTEYPLVNALMRQLVATGWMSNRGRQIAASCLVNELGLDWRYGAAFFEKHLLDYDVASNYGNWQYIAGVGADPRGGRHFNLEKQAQEYDPEDLFVEKWDGRRPSQPEYVTDAADWPIAGA
jgi:deoxyribodipyrimidine photo-lyase